MGRIELDYTKRLTEINQFVAKMLVYNSELSVGLKENSSILNKFKVLSEWYDFIHSVNEKFASKSEDFLCLAHLEYLKKITKILLHGGSDLKEERRILEKILEKNDKVFTYLSRRDAFEFIEELHTLHIKPKSNVQDHAKEIQFNHVKYFSIDTNLFKEGEILNILLISSNPKGKTQLNLNKEISNIQEIIQNSDNKNRINISISLTTTKRKFRKELLVNSPDIVHFGGHGDPLGIFLEGENLDDQTVLNDSLLNAFKLFSDSVKCVFLNSCYSMHQAKLISEYIPFVIGMGEAVSDATAIEFSHGFYESLGAGRDIEFCYRYGLLAISLNDISSSGIPRLYQNGEMTSANNA